MTLSPGSVNLLELLTQFRECFTYHVTILLQKDMSQIQPDERDAKDKAWEKGQSFHDLKECTILPPAFTCSPPQSLA